VHLYKEYDVISNKYKVNDKEKMMADKQIALYDAADKYWKYNDFNPVKVEFCDKGKNDKNNISLIF